MFNGSPLDKRPLWYSNPIGEKTPVVDEWGNETGGNRSRGKDFLKIQCHVVLPPIKRSR
jgi:hypothetical protein